MHLCIIKRHKKLQILKSNNTIYFYWAVIGWALLILRHGYTFGIGDHAEILPYIEHLCNTSKYANDFYVSSISSLVPNVRWFFACFFSPFVHNLSCWFFIFHALYTLLLLLGTMKVCEKLKIHAFISFLGIMGYLLLFYGHIPGGNEWYLNNFQTENVAFILGIWAVNWALVNKQWLAITALLFATLFHPLAGFQFALLVGASLFFIQKLNWKAWLVYVSTGGAYFVMILFNHQSNFEVLLDLPSFFEVLFVFRQPHHSIPTTYSLLGTLLSLFLLIGALLATYKNQKILFYMLGLIGIGCVVYTIGVVHFKSVLIAQSQWFKTVSLVTVLGSVLVLNSLISYFPKLIEFILKVENKLAYAVILSLVWIGLLFTFPVANILQKPMLFGKASTVNPLIDISKRISQELPQEAVFIQPFDADAFHYYSGHASYVSFKAVVHHQSFMYEWYKRINQVYDVNIGDEGGFSLTQKANFNYEKKLREGIIDIPINYALVKKGKYKYPVVMSNSQYQVLLIHPVIEEFIGSMPLH